ncbi:portal protein [Perilla frutescens var. frutescens]|nr:portal protein [Perilla frutescens var. frutescens]
MFTEGLDESAINWIKKGSDSEQYPSRSPLSEKLDTKYHLPRSPLSYNSSSYTSSHALPPLKFHSGLLKPLSTITLSAESNEDDSDYYNDDNDDEGESVGSAPHGNCGNTSDDDAVDGPVIRGFEEDMFHLNACKKLNDVKYRSTLNRGLLKEDLRVEVPGSLRRFTGGEWGSRGYGQSSAVSGGSCRLNDRKEPNSAYGTPIGKLSENVGLGTPSAPPFMDIGNVHDCEAGSDESIDSKYKELEQGFSGNKGFVEQSNKSVKTETEVVRRDVEEVLGENEHSTPAVWHANSANHIPYYCASSQNAYQALVAYDACIRLCLNSWARGCTEAPEFLRDECLLLRNAFGLHKLLLQPRGVQQAEMDNKTTEQAMASKVKRTVGKIRVEVKKLRIIQRRKLKDTNSMRGAIYLQAGADYVRHVSSIVKHRINALKLSPFSFPSEESLCCVIQLKSLAEDNEAEAGSAFSLRPGAGEYHDFFPESQGDALLLEVQDLMKNVQGCATIPISSLTDNPNEKVRWWPIYHSDHECVGKVLLSIGSTFTSDETVLMKSGSIVETLAYDLLLEAGMRALQFHARNLRIDGPWKWILTEFAEYYGVSHSYTKLRYLSYVMNVATPTKDCLEILHELLVPVLKARSERNLTRQEKSILLDCETQVERLLAEVFQNYKSLDENSPTGLADMSAPASESAPPALAPAVQLYTLLHDILSQDAQTMLRNYLKTAATKRCRKHMLETDEFVSSNTEGFVMDSDTITKAYSKMKNLCINISNEIQSDIKIHNQHIFPSSIDLSAITSAVYSTEMSKRLGCFLAAWPPSSPMPHVNDLLIAMSDFERSLELWNISPVQGGIDSRDLYHDYIMVWIQDLQLTLLDLCKAEKVPWSGVYTKYATSPFAEEMFEKMEKMLSEYEVVINRWPQYTLILENAAANVERAIIKAMERQYHDILTPLRDSIPKRLGMQVQKLARRQSTAYYSIPSQLGIFLNTIKRILDVLHCRNEEKLKSWASYLPANGDSKTTFGEQMNAITVLLRTKYKNYIQAIVVKLAGNMLANKSTRLQRILEETKEADGEAQIRERMQLLSTQLSDCISKLHETFTSQIFVAITRAFWDKMGQIVLKFLEGRKENRVWYTGSYHALGILDDTYASQMQRLLGNALQEKDLEPPRSITEARSILSRDTTNRMDSSSYIYF